MSVWRMDRFHLLKWNISMRTVTRLRCSWIAIYWLCQVYERVCQQRNPTGLRVRFLGDGFNYPEVLVHPAKGV